MSTKFSTRKIVEHSLLLSGISKPSDQFSHLVQLNHKSLLVFLYFHVPKKVIVHFNVLCIAQVYSFQKVNVLKILVRSLFKIPVKYIDKIKPESKICGSAPYLFQYSNKHTFICSQLTTLLVINSAYHCILCKIF